jgi:hypothetical protein
MNNNSKAGFTKTGFSKAGFAACSHFNECLMGKLSCYYEKIDPEVKEYCFCYQRNHGSDTTIELNTPEKQKDNNEEDMQLSFF